MPQRVLVSVDQCFPRVQAFQIRLFVNSESNYLRRYYKIKSFICSNWIFLNILKNEYVIYTFAPGVQLSWRCDNCWMRTATCYFTYKLSLKVRNQFRLIESDPVSVPQLAFDSSTPTIDFTYWIGERNILKSKMQVVWTGFLIALNEKIKDVWKRQETYQRSWEP